MNKLFLLLPLIVLVSCSVAPRGGLPPVVDNSSQAAAGDAAGSAGVEVYALPDAGSDNYDLEPLEDGSPRPLPGPATAPATPPRGGSHAVIALLDRAEQYGQSGQVDAAAAALERALRIEPRNARLWSKLAAVRLQQGQPEQAEQLALKSNALSISDRSLQANNWRIVAKARWARGDNNGARQAEKKVRELQAYR